MSSLVFVKVSTRFTFLFSSPRIYFLRNELNWNCQMECMQTFCIFPVHFSAASPYHHIYLKKKKRSIFQDKPTLIVKWLLLFLYLLSICKIVFKCLYLIFKTAFFLHQLYNQTVQASPMVSLGPLCSNLLLCASFMMGKKRYQPLLMVTHCVGVHVQSFFKKIYE